MLHVSCFIALLALCVLSLWHSIANVNSCAMITRLSAHFSCVPVCKPYQVSLSAGLSFNEGGVRQQPFLQSRRKHGKPVPRIVCGHAVSNTPRPSESRAEYLVQQLEQEIIPESVGSQIEDLKSKLAALEHSIDDSYSRILSGRQTRSEQGDTVQINSAADLRLLARDEPEVRASSCRDAVT
jgi:hypothetical protein